MLEQLQAMTDITLMRTTVHVRISFDATLSIADPEAAMLLKLEQKLTCETKTQTPNMEPSLQSTDILSKTSTSPNSMYQVRNAPSSPCGFGKTIIANSS